MEILNNIFQYFSRFFDWWVTIMPFEQGMRVRFGNKIRILNAGLYFKIPFFDTVFVQTINLRVINLPVQTITTKDNKTLSIAGCVQYRISDIQKLYNTLYNPDMTITSMVMSNIAELVNTNNIEDCTPLIIQDKIQVTDADQYGLVDLKVTILSYAVVKTYRLIQDGHFMYENMPLERTKGK